MQGQSASIAIFIQLTVFSIHNLVHFHRQPFLQHTDKLAYQTVSTIYNPWPCVYDKQQCDNYHPSCQTQSQNISPSNNHHPSCLTRVWKYLHLTNIIFLSGTAQRLFSLKTKQKKPSWHVSLHASCCFKLHTFLLHSVFKPIVNSTPQLHSDGINLQQKLLLRFLT